MIEPHIDLNKRICEIEEELTWLRVRINHLEKKIEKCKLTSMLFGLVGLLAIAALLLSLIK